MTQTATEIATAVRAGELTARQAVAAALARIEAADSRLNAYQEVRVFAALREADGVDARPDKESLPLAGVPVAIKDNVPVTGEPMRVARPAPTRRRSSTITRSCAACARPALSSWA